VLQTIHKLHFFKDKLREVIQFSNTANHKLALKAVALNLTNENHIKALKTISTSKRVMKGENIL
jgi:hypothetical protein